MFEDQKVELLPARTTMKSMGHWGRGGLHHVNITFNVYVQQTIIQQVSYGNNSPNVALLFLSRAW